MRRLLAAIVTCGSLLALTVPATAAASRRVPSGVARVSVSLTFPLRTVASRDRPVHRTFAKAATVATVVAATDALPAARRRGVCPMIVMLGPELTVVFRSASGTALAQAQVQVTTGSHGSSGSSSCFPIRFSSRGRGAALVGNGWVRRIGRLIGTAIS